MIEAAIIGRPVFSMLAEEFAGTQEGLDSFPLSAARERRLRPDRVDDRRARPAVERAAARSGGGACRDAAVHLPLHPPAWARPAGDADLRRRDRAIGRGAGAARRSRRRCGRYLLRPVVLAAAPCRRRSAGGCSGRDPFDGCCDEAGSCTGRTTKTRRPNGAADRASWSQRQAVARDRAAAAARSHERAATHRCARLTRTPRRGAAGGARADRSQARRGRARQVDDDRHAADGARARRRRTADRQGSSRAAAGGARRRRAAAGSVGCSTRSIRSPPAAGPILIGPWTGEVGFELLYWIPFVEWVRAHWQLSPGARADRLARRRGVVVRARRRPRTSTSSRCSAPDEFRARGRRGEAQASPAGRVRRARRPRPSSGIAAAARSTCCIPG